MQAPNKAFAGAALALSAFAAAAPASADTTLGTTGGMTYVSDSTAPVPSGTESTSPVVYARCPSATELLGGSVGMDYGGTGAHLHTIYPTTTEDDEGSLGLTFWNNSGDNRVGTVVAACSNQGNPGYYAEFGEIFSAPAVLGLTATCPGSRHVTGGGFFTNLPGHEVAIDSSYPVSDDRWKVRVRTRAGGGGSVAAYAICTKAPAVAYREKRIQLQVADFNQPFVRCGPGQHAISAGVKIFGPANQSVLNALELYDTAFDGDLAPDDGAVVRVAKVNEPQPAVVHAICRR